MNESLNILFTSIGKTFVTVFIISAIITVIVKWSR